MNTESTFDSLIVSTNLHTDVSNENAAARC